MEAKWLILTGGIVLAAVLLYGFFFLAPLAFQPGSEMPLTGTIDLELKERQLTEGARMKVIQGETVVATWNAEWFNRNSTRDGGNNVAGLWYVDGEFLEMMPGETKAIDTVYCFGTNPAIGCIVELKWNWRTLPIVATLPVEGQTVEFTRTIEIDTTNLQKGTHQIVTKAYPINGPTSVGIFSGGDPMGVCYPAQTREQGFPCPGIYGTSERRSRLESVRCPLHPSPYLADIRQWWLCDESHQWPNCTGGICSAYCGTWCCEDWYYSWGTSAATGADGKLVVTCGDSGPYVVWGAWSDWAQTVEQTQETVTANAITGAETISITEFEIVEKCPFECCIELEGYQDKTCINGEICTPANECVKEILPCPNECCAGLEDYFDKDCLEGKACVNSQCQLIVTDCPFECCEGETAYHDKACTEEKTCENNECKTPVILPVCGNGECETGENATNCPSDCHVEGPPDYTIYAAGIAILIVAILGVFAYLKLRH